LPVIVIYAAQDAVTATTIDKDMTPLLGKLLLLRVIPSKPA
jgi:hypothetical protein